MNNESDYDKEIFIKLKLNAVDMFLMTIVMMNFLIDVITSFIISLMFYLHGLFLFKLIQH